MRFEKQAIISLGSAAALLVFGSCDAFVFSQPKNKLSPTFLVPSSTLSYSVSGTGGSSSSSTRLFASLEDDDDEEDDHDDEEDDNTNPLGKGVNSVSWLPSVVGQSGQEISGLKEGSEILPLFPLGGFVYTPNTEHVLNIFEPRYRQMYTDILMNGTKRFVVVTSHPTEQGRFAQTGVLFELEDLKEVSEQTADQIKYICNHKVTGRVTIHKVLNPEVWETRETYLKVEGTIHDDSGKSGDDDDDGKSNLPENDVYGAVLEAGETQKEKELKVSFNNLVEIQHELEEDVRFTRGASETLAVKDGAGGDGLWQTVRLWQSFVDQRLLAAQNELQRDFQAKLQEYLRKDKGLKDEELPSAIGFQDLTPELQAEVQELQKRMAVELQPLVLESSLTMQKILEARNHSERLGLVKYFMDSETKRLESKKTLKGIFSSTTTSSIGGGSSTVTETMPPTESSIPAEEMISNDDDDDNKSKSEGDGTETSSFFDDPDAFQ